MLWVFYVEENWHGFFTKSRAKNVTFKLTKWIH